MEFLGFFMAGLVFLAIIVLFLAYIFNPNAGKQKRGFNNGPVNLLVVPAKWIDVKAMMAQGGPANYRQSIMEGDKLVDMVLRSKVSGETMGERLKNAKHLFSYNTYQGLWTAHKIRNKIAHEADFEGLDSDARLAVGNFEKALKELRVI
jgi:hypothetical protein